MNTPRESPYPIDSYQEVVPIEGIRPKRGQVTTPGTPCPTPFEQCVGSFTPRRIVNNEELRDGAFGLSPLSQRTRKSFADVITKAALSTQLFKDPE